MCFDGEKDRQARLMLLVDPFSFCFCCKIEHSHIFKPISSSIWISRKPFLISFFLSKWVPVLFSDLPLLYSSQTFITHLFIFPFQFIIFFFFCVTYASNYYRFNLSLGCIYLRFSLFWITVFINYCWVWLIGSNVIHCLYLIRFWVLKSFCILESSFNSLWLGLWHHSFSILCGLLKKKNYCSEKER